MIPLVKLPSSLSSGTKKNKWWTLIKSEPDRKSTRLNSSHSQISYAVFCLNKKAHSSMADRRAHEPAGVETREPDRPGRRLPARTQDGVQLFRDLLLLDRVPRH